jgi:hypothetical protein
MVRITSTYSENDSISMSYFAMDIRYVNTSCSNANFICSAREFYFCLQPSSRLAPVDTIPHVNRYELLEVSERRRRSSDELLHLRLEIIEELKLTHA